MTMMDLIRRRYSCRTYLETPIAEGPRQALEAAIAAAPPGPFAASNRFMLAAASAQDRSALQGLRTYGFIRGAPAFIIGAAQDGPKALEDFGYRMEHIILSATHLGLGTCWLGGTFTRSGFAQKIAAGADEILPAVCAVGVPAAERGMLEQAMRKNVGADNRLAWDTLFFDGDFRKPLTSEAAAGYAVPLEMVRLGPSASNKQPWRILREDSHFHFYIQRTPGYREAWITRLLGVADMQRVDLGIAMCHFALSAAELGLDGSWQVSPPDLETPNVLTEYVVTWAAKDLA